jgi:hypothetical protein
VLNEFHGGTCGGHLSRLQTTQRILCIGYFWPTIFKDCVESIKKFHPCHVFTKNMHMQPASMFHVITIDPFTKSGVDFMTCHTTSSRGHHYIIVAIEYFTKWAEAMPTFANDSETVALFIFNQVITRFTVPKEIVTDHGSHFQNHMMFNITSKLGFSKENSSPYYPHDNN